MEGLHALTDEEMSFLLNDLKNSTQEELDLSSYLLPDSSPPPPHPSTPASSSNILTDERALTDDEMSFLLNDLQYSTQEDLDLSSYLPPDYSPPHPSTPASSSNILTDEELDKIFNPPASYNNILSEEDFNELFAQQRSPHDITYEEEVVLLKELGNVLRDFPMDLTASTLKLKG